MGGGGKCFTSRVGGGGWNSYGVIVFGGNSFNFFHDWRTKGLKNKSFTVFLRVISAFLAATF